MIFFTADWHLGETRLELMRRPFTFSEYNKILIDRHNQRVSKNDTVYVNGDVLYRNADPEYLKLVSAFNGRKILIRGNHDRHISDHDFLHYFEQVIPEGEGVELDDLYITHYPTRARIDKFNLTGHIHDAWKFQLNCINVGVDVHNFSPVSLDEIAAYRVYIREYYDDDVWSAYHISNLMWLDRHKQGSYYVSNSSQET
jgi:calcineurin-like phosphoesterase family protein